MGLWMAGLGTILGAVNFITTIICRGGSISFDTPMVWTLGFLVTFRFGGLTGVILASPPLDLMPRRYADYLPQDGFTTLNQVSTVGSFLLAASTFPFLYNVWISRNPPLVGVDDPGAGAARWSGPPAVHHLATTSRASRGSGPSLRPSTSTARRSRSWSSTRTPAEDPTCWSTLPTPSRTSRAPGGTQPRVHTVRQFRDNHTQTVRHFPVRPGGGGDRTARDTRRWPLDQPLIREDRLTQDYGHLPDRKATCPWLPGASLGTQMS